MNQQHPLTPDKVRRWGRYAENSPLYRHLNEVIADDESLLSVLNQIEHLPRQNVLFAGVQYLMLRDGGGRLAGFYPNFSDDPGDTADVDDVFRTFVLDHADELAEIGRTRYTQTNECRRCVALLPAIWSTGVESFHLVDFGASSGLNLQLDRYNYRWGDVSWGPGSNVELETEVRGQPVVPRDIEIVSRTGLDVNPLDPGHADARLWLEALIWPEHHDRRQRLLAALQIAATNPPELVEGDALQTLGPVIDGLPDSEPVVVINSFILNQFPSADRTRYRDILNAGRSDRPVHQVSMEWLDSDAGGSDIIIDDGSGPHKVGMAHPHGEWLDLYARP